MIPELNEKFVEKQQKMYDALKGDVIKFFASYLTPEDKEDLQAAYMSAMVVLAISANMAASLGVSKESFLIGCSNIYDAEKLSVEVENEEGEEPIPSKNLDLN